ncbi:MAG: hypothetical protein KF883_01625 [Thermomicrobiales bacterium]|nr:hypothetical protein [Thermomicrobiales bacterium]
MTTVTIEPESKLAEALRQAARTGDVVIVRAGDASYTMNVEPELTPRDTPETLAAQGEAFRSAVDAAFGTWNDDYAEEFKAYVRERRKSGSRPSVEL